MLYNVGCQCIVLYVACHGELYNIVLCCIVGWCIIMRGELGEFNICYGALLYNIVGQCNGLHGHM